MNSQYFCSLIHYYCENGFYQSMQKTCLDALTKFPSNNVFRLYNGIALIFSNNFQEGIRELKPLKSEKDFGLCATLTLLYGNKLLNNENQTDTLLLEANFHDQLESCTDKALYYISLFYFFTEQYEKCREITEKISDDDNDSLIIIKTLSTINERKKISHNLQTHLERIVNNKFSIDATLALVKLYTTLGRGEIAIQLLDKLCIRYPELNIFVVEKMYIYISLFDWEQAYEISLRIINLDPMNINALLMKSIILIIKEYNINYAVSVIRQLLNALEQQEINSNKLVLYICRTISQVCSRNSEILTILSSFLEKLTYLYTKNTPLITDYGFILLMTHKVSEASLCFQAALKIDSCYLKAIIGLLRCKAYTNVTKETLKNDMDNYKEFHIFKRNPYFIFLKLYFTESSDEAIKLLNEVVELHLYNVKNLCFGIKYLTCLDPDFLIDIITVYIRQYSEEATRVFHNTYTAETKHIAVSQSNFLLKTLLKACPAHIDGIYLLSKLDFIRGDISSSLKSLHRISNGLDPNCIKAKLLLAKVYLEKGQLSQVFHWLEMALSTDFSIRRSPLYYLLLGIVESRRNNVNESIKNFSSALQLVDSKLKPEKSENIFGRSVEEFSNTEKLTLYLEYSQILRTLNDQNSAFESERLMQLATEEFHNTPQEGRVLIAKAEMLIANNSILKAIRCLESVKEEEPHFAEVNIYLANIYLKYRKDRIAFANCFKKLIHTFPGPDSYHLIADAYMNIEEPDISIQLLQKGVELFPHNSLLMRQLGRTFVKAHRYKEAIEYYKQTILENEHINLELDLAELYLKLNKFQDGILLLKKTVDHQQRDQQGNEYLECRTKAFLLLARIYEKSGNFESSLEALKEAKKNQMLIMTNAGDKNFDYKNDGNNLYLK